MKKNKIHKLEIKRYKGLILILILFIMSFYVQFIFGYKYSDQNLDFIELPPIVKIRYISPDAGIYIHKDLYPVLFNKKGELIGLLKQIKTGLKKDIYLFDNDELIVDCSDVKDFKNIDYDKIKIIYKNKNIDKFTNKLVWNKTYIFGTDRLGRDIFLRVFQGIKISLIVGFTASVVNLFIGVIYGSVAGYVGGKIDIIMLNFLNVINSIPSILLVILLSLFVPPGIWSIIIIIGLVYWVSMARQVRAGVMALKRRDFILAEILIGTPQYKIIFKHILPNMKETILTILIVNIQNAVFTETFLSFLGIGLPAPIASLGTLINDSITNFRSSPSQLIIPSLAILLVLICFQSQTE